MTGISNGFGGFSTTLSGIIPPRIGLLASYFAFIERSKFCWNCKFYVMKNAFRGL